MAIECTKCDDEGFIETDRSYGDYTIAVRVECTACEGTKVAPCSECGDRQADKLSPWLTPVCNQCHPTFYGEV